MPPPGIGLEQVMNPRMFNLCPAQMNVLFTMIDQRISRQKDEEDRGIC